MPIALILLLSYASRAMANVKIKLPQKQCIYCGVGNYREVDIEDPTQTVTIRAPLQVTCGSVNGNWSRHLRTQNRRLRGTRGLTLHSSRPRAVRWPAGQAGW